MFYVHHSSFVYNKHLELHVHYVLFSKHAAASLGCIIDKSQSIRRSWCKNKFFYPKLLRKNMQKKTKERGSRKSNLISAQAYIMRLFCGACFAEPFFWYIRNAKMDVITMGGVKGGGDQPYLNTFLPSRVKCL